VVLAELPEGAPEVAEFERHFLGGGNRMFRDRRLVERHIARMVLAALVVVEVAQNGEDPGLEVGARAELMSRRQSADGGVMHEIVGPVAVPRKRAREGAQMGNVVDQGRTELRRCFLDSRLTRPLPRSPGRLFEHAILHRVLDMKALHGVAFLGLARSMQKI
jgi:hypothetical protein